VSARPRDRVPESGVPGATIAVTVVFVVVGIVRLRDLPVFGDEAIFLRLAELVRKDPARHLWISLSAAAAPLHTWLLAAAWPLSADPVRSGRLLSGLAGAAAVPAFAWTVGELTRWSRTEDDSGPHGAGIFAAILVATSPFLLTSARLARVDALFAAETILLAAAALAAARRLTASAARVEGMLAFGLLLGLTMATRTAVSYPFWALLPVAAFLAPRGAGKARPSRVFAASLLSLAVAAVLFAPYALARGPGDLATRLFHY
jgi:hypothetical protein